jgi:hypothetical protein
LQGIGNWELGIGAFFPFSSEFSAITNYSLAITHYQLPITHFLRELLGYPLKSAQLVFHIFLRPRGCKVIETKSN